MASTLTLADLVLARLRSTAKFATFDGEVPDTPPGAYVVFYGDTGAARRERYAGPAKALTWGFYAVCAGFSPAQVRNTVDLVRGLLTDWRPLADRDASPLNEADIAADMLRDSSVPSDIRYSQTLRYNLTTTRS
jgi:hypothetical protein